MFFSNGQVKKVTKKEEFKKTIPSLSPADLANKLVLQLPSQ